MKKALVLPGGGVRGAFQIGVLLYLIKEKGQRYDIITGVSVGALNGSFLAQYKKECQREAIDDLYKLWLTIENKTIKKHWFPFSYLHGLWRKSLYNSKPLQKLVDKNLDKELIKKSGIDLSVLAVSLDSGKVESFDSNSPNLKDAVKASAAFPVFFLPVKIGNEWFVDGGVREVAPLNEAIDKGAEHITIINTGPLASSKVRAKKMKTFGISLRAIDLQGVEVVTNDLKKFVDINKKLASKNLIDSSKRIIDFSYIEPKKILTESPLEFNPKEIKEMIQKGYDAAKEYHSTLNKNDKSPSI